MADPIVTPTADMPPAVEGGGGGLGEGKVKRAARAGGEEAMAQAKAAVRDAADEQRRRAASAVDGMAGALHRAATDLESENEMIGRYTHIAAERLNEVADYLRSTGWDDVMGGAEDFARRQPYWFVGGAAMVGFVLARAVKNAGPGPRRMPRRMSAAQAPTSALGGPGGTGGYGASAGTDTGIGMPGDTIPGAGG
ncbi:hypothetical protein [Magnetospirillum sp. UT-4]|uniref:hypothetical protein n=1 Tax=Magnetospirillum sp. UT-4 TaxID=2681467 RepID=UPI001385F26A|nr:hypothetical protein [Magnetospirillum sp. UT-4]CAA7619419.1 hypothetical protein MTBUT4_300068 [Magnetospirillum sp. UT-4]